MRWIATFSLLMLLIGSLSGCAQGQRRGRTYRLWADVNTLGSPAVFWETQKHGRYPNATVNHFRWMYGRGPHTETVVPETEYSVASLEAENTTEPEQVDNPKLAPVPVDPGGTTPDRNDAPAPGPIPAPQTLPKSPPAPFSEDEPKSGPVPPTFESSPSEESLSKPVKEKPLPSTVPDPVLTPDGPTAQARSPITHSVFQRNGQAGPTLIAPQEFVTPDQQPARIRIELLPPESSDLQLELLEPQSIP